MSYLDRLKPEDPNQPFLFQPTAANVMDQTELGVVNRERGKVENIVAKKPLPEGYRIVSRPGTREHQVEMYDNEDEKIGEVSWHPVTGHVKWLGVHSSENIYTSHLLDAAVKLADQTRTSPPITSTSLSDDSYRLMNRRVPEFLDRKNTTVEGLGINAINPETHSFLHALRSHIAQTHAETLQQLGPVSSGQTTLLTDHARECSADIDNALKAASSNQRIFLRHNLTALSMKMMDMEDFSQRYNLKSAPKWTALSEHVNQLEEGTHSTAKLHADMNGIDAQ
jgi:hypothetical protein